MWASNPFYPSKSLYQWSGYKNRSDCLNTLAKWGRMTVGQVEEIEKSMGGSEFVLPSELEQEIERRRTPCPTCGT